MNSDRALHKFYLKNIKYLDKKIKKRIPSLLLYNSLDALLLFYTLKPVNYQESCLVPQLDIVRISESGLANIISTAKRSKNVKVGEVWIWRLHLHSLLSLLDSLLS